jgi:hypothetical protein
LRFSREFIELIVQSASVPPPLPARVPGHRQDGPNEYRFIALWGQFLDRHGHLKATTARTLLDGLGRHLTEESLEHCFPYRVLRLESAVRPFYEFYGIV